VAQAQERFAEAEASYRQAMEIYLESDQRSASMTATRLGLLLAKDGGNADAAGMLLDGAVAWHQLTGDWDPADLRYLKRERQIIGESIHANGHRKDSRRLSGSTRYRD
jgi:hypothetical protein